jgi:hypothetical protein
MYAPKQGPLDTTSEILSLFFLDLCKGEGCASEFLVLSKESVASSKNFNLKIEYTGFICLSLHPEQVLRPSGIPSNCKVKK